MSSTVSLLFMSLMALCCTRAIYINDDMGVIDDTDMPDYDEFPADNGAMYIEGDIEVDLDRNAVAFGFNVWDNGQVPYRISSQYPQSEQDKILEAMREIETDVNGPQGTCIKFVPRTTETHYVYIIPVANTCSSKVGRVSLTSPQHVKLGRVCMNRGVIMHELLHALGFYHEHNNPNRGKYVSIDLSNVQSGEEHNFHMRLFAKLLNAPYDYNSIMHYEVYTSAKDPIKPVMIPKPGNVVHGKMGQRINLTDIDVLKIQRLYKCPEDTSNIQGPNMSPADWCSFEDGFCGLKQDPHADFNWVVQSTPSESGPQADDSTGVTNYAIAKAANHTGRTARLLTRMYTDQKLCINMYLFNHEQKGTFQLRYREKTTHSFITRYTYEGRSFKKWYQLRMTINRPRFWPSYQLAFEATPDTKDIAIDDVNIYPGNC